MCVNSQAFSVFAIVLRLLHTRIRGERKGWLKMYVRASRRASHNSWIIHGKCSPSTSDVRSIFFSQTSFERAYIAARVRRGSGTDKWGSSSCRSAWRRSQSLTIITTYVLYYVQPHRRAHRQPRVNAMGVPCIAYQKQRILTRFSVKIGVISRWTINLYFLLELRAVICV